MTRRSIARLRAGGAIRKAILAVCLAAAGVAGDDRPAGAYQLYKQGKCWPASAGQKWDTSRPIKVRLLSDSAWDWIAMRVQPATAADWTRLLDDIAAVVELYNSVPGSGLRLEFDPFDPIGGDKNLNFPKVDDFGDQTIVIGFTDEVAASSATAEAFAPAISDSGDDCKLTRAHVMFRKTFTNSMDNVRTYNWIFGPPDTTDVHGRAFWTADQPWVAGASNPRSFLGILTHEMGHALGLGHPNENYAIMAQGFRTWFRGPDHVLRTRLLPDDMAGLIALYGDGSDRDRLDISATNTWYERGDLRADCSTEEAAVARLEREIGQLEASFPGSQGAGSHAFLEELAALVAEHIDAQDDLQSCRDSEAAGQTQNCKVSSRGDRWVHRSEEEVFCGANDAIGSAPVGDRVCPGSMMQLRYTLNNHSLARDVLAKAEVWLSPTSQLDVRSASVLKSPDVREFTVSALDSSTIGQNFRMPAGAQDGQAYEVFVRVVPYDPASGADLWSKDLDKWNNAIMLRSGVTASSAACN